MQHRPYPILLPLLLLLLPTRTAQAALFHRLDPASAPATARAFELPGSAPTARALASPETAPAAVLLGVDRDALAAFRAAGGGRLELPLAEGGALALELEPYDLLAPGALQRTDASGAHALAVDVSLYRGRVAGQAESWAVVAMGAAGVFGTIEERGRHWSLGPASRGAGAVPAGAPLPAHALTLERGRAPGEAAFDCGLHAGNELEQSAPLPPGTDRLALKRGAAATVLTATRTVWKIAVDCDYEVFHDKFADDLTAATSYALAVLGTVNLLYERDLAATLSITYLNFWTTAAEPYTATNTATQLTQFASYWNVNHAAIPRAAAFLMSGRPLGGGNSFIGGLCSNSSGYALAAMDFTYAYPTPGSTWDVTVVAHELGHVFGSWHTHSCNWGLNGYAPANTTLDSCFASEGGCAAYTDHLPPAKGTIMSYCFVQFGVADGIRLEFHPACVQRIRAVMAVSACSTQMLPQPPRSPAAVAQGSGVRVSWTAGGSPNVLGYEVWRSASALDTRPERAGFTSALQFDDASLGLHYYRVRTVRAADTSSWSLEAAAASACGSVAGAPATAGAVPIAGLTADLNGDGREDALFLRSGDGSLGLVLGQGAGSVGNGTFAAPVAIPTLASPRCMALDDVTGDGIPDVLVAGLNPIGMLSLHRGNGAAGVPNGTFQPAAGLTTFPYGYAPAAMITADTDEDGIPDVLIAAGSTVLRAQGLGSGGVPNGTFGTLRSTPVDMATVDLAAHDFNADGILDLAVTGSAGLRILRGSGLAGRGDGTFNLPATYAAGLDPGRLAVGDFNLDGADDVAVADRADTVLRVFLGNRTGGVPDGTFAPALVFGAGPHPGAIRVLDWDRNGIPDLVVANETTPGTVSVLLGRAASPSALDALFASRVVVAAGGDSTSDLVVSDFDENGALETLAASRTAGSFARLAGSCAGALSNAVTLVSPNGGESWAGRDERAVTWTKGAGVLSVDLQMSLNGGVAWRTIVRELTGTSWKWTVPSLSTTQARLRVVVHGMPQQADASNANFSIAPGNPVGVDGPPPGLALLGAWPNPARDQLVAAFTLPASGRGTLELEDVLGRRVASRDLGAFGPGRHEVTLFDHRRLAPGVYLMRLRSGAELRLAKVSVVN